LQIPKASEAKPPPALPRTEKEREEAREADGRRQGRLRRAERQADQRASEVLAAARAAESCDKTGAERRRERSRGIGRTEE
jgi:hypothetical protein